MRHLAGMIMPSGDIRWQVFGDQSYEREQAVCVEFSFSGPEPSARPPEMLAVVREAVARSGISWIRPGPDEWSFDLDGLRDAVPRLRDLAWLAGKIRTGPEFDHGDPEQASGASHRSSLRFLLMPRQIPAGSGSLPVPPAIGISLERFRQDHPDPAKVGFLMLRDGGGVVHDRAATAIRAGLACHGITALRSDDKRYHDDPLSNLLTYIHGCGFGVAVLERLDGGDFNPKVSLAAGALLALGKPVCLLKDQALPAPAGDPFGLLYRNFDPHDPEASIPRQLQQWMVDQGPIA
ncbi:MAG TPA: hypothetical protein VEC06_12525 [Paucimonas sp.]|nr:hypothetical protein [Paucimonas sp.]